MTEAPRKGRFVLELPHFEAALALSGEANQTLDHLKALTGAYFVIRGLQLEIQGSPSELEKAIGVLELSRYLWQEGQNLSLVDLRAALIALNEGKANEHAALRNEVLARSQSGELLRPRTCRQKEYLKAIQSHDLTFAIGPAGTGKTFLATLLGVGMLNDRRVERLLIARPAIEAGERLGFLPGDLQQKVDPFLRPIYDALHTLLGVEKTSILLERGLIEVAPLAYMRGRTLDKAFVILDEAQNTTTSQMRMVLTRLGEHSRMVVTGDLTQVDLPHGQESGLAEAVELLGAIEGVNVCQLTAEDIVRHPLVQKVVNAYARKDSK